MRPEDFDFYSIGDAADVLDVPRANLRYYIDMGKVPCRRASDGSRMLTHDDLKAARKWIGEHEAKKAREKKARQELKERAARNRAKRAARAA